MELFTTATSENINILPFHGEVYYRGKIFSEQRSNQFFEDLYRELAWKQDEGMIYGKHYVTKRKVAWYGDEGVEYEYSKMKRRALPWNEVLLEIKKEVEKISQDTFNACLCNLYHRGDEAMSWHSDDEPELKKEGTIASLSFGAARVFQFRHKQEKHRVNLILEHGSLLLMKGVTQGYWQHQLPASKKILQPRINLTFRTIVGK